jgi:hypothetical protein
MSSHQDELSYLKLLLQELLDTILTEKANSKN